MTSVVDRRAPGEDKGTVFVLLAWREAFLFITRAPNWRQKLSSAVPCCSPARPLGWPLALGYRREVALRLVRGREPVLPGWAGAWRDYLADGLGAAGVILAYYLPFLGSFWAMALDGPDVALRYPGEIALFFLAVALLIPLGLPLLPPLYGSLFPWVRLTPTEAVVLGLVFFATAFVLPAAILHVSLRGRYRDALRLGRALGFIARHPRLYLEAWSLSLAVTVLALASGPLAPWGIFWSYLTIVHAFNEALARSGEPGVREAFRDSRLLPTGDTPQSGSRRWPDSLEQASQNEPMMSRGGPFSST